MAEDISHAHISQKSYRPVSVQGVQIVIWRNNPAEKKKRSGNNQRDQEDPRILKALGQVFYDQQHDAEEWICGRTERGKPFFIHHSEVQFSLSDSENLTAVAFAPESVGLDIQLHQRHGIRRTEADENNRLSKLARRFYHPDERDFVLQTPFGSMAETDENILHEAYQSAKTGIRRRFYRIWTAKEAYVKFTGQGIDGQFTKLSVMPEDPDGIPAQMSGVSVIDHPVVWQALNCRFYYAEPEEGLSLCVCTESELPVSIMCIEEHAGSTFVSENVRAE